MAVGDAYVFPGFLTSVLTQLFLPKPPTTFLTRFCRGKGRKYAGKSRLNRGSNLQPPGHESDTLITEPPGGASANVKPWFLWNYFKIWPAVSEKIFKNFFTSVYCKKTPFTRAMFVDGSKFCEQFLKRVSQGIFLWNHFKIGPAVSERQISFKKFFMSG